MIAVACCCLLTAFHALAHFFGLDALMVIADLLFFQTLVLPVFLPFFLVFFTKLTLAFQRLLFFRSIPSFLRLAGIPEHEEAEAAKNDSEKHDGNDLKI